MLLVLLAGYSSSYTETEIVSQTIQHEKIKILDCYRWLTPVFMHLTEKLSINPLLLTEDYIVSILNFEEYTYLRPFLSEQDYSKLLSRKEDDNPCLVKYYFRKDRK